VSRKKTKRQPVRRVPGTELEPSRPVPSGSSPPSPPLASTPPPPPAQPEKPYVPRRDGRVLQRDGDEILIDLGDRDHLREFATVQIELSREVLARYSTRQVEYLKAEGTVIKVLEETAWVRLKSTRPGDPVPGDRVWLK
jgi:hypothetical protein